MKLRIILICALLAARVSAMDIISGGTVFRDCTDLRAEGHALLFKHADGTARVRYNQLPESLLNKYFTASRIAELRAVDRMAADAVKNIAEADKKRAARRTEAVPRPTPPPVSHEPLSADEYAERERKRNEARAKPMTAAEQQFAAAEEAIRRTQQGIRNRQPAPPTPAPDLRTASEIAALEAETDAAAEKEKAEERKARARSSAIAAALAREKNVQRVIVMLGCIILFVFGVWVYFLPSWVGRHKENFTAILVLNVFLGWTFLGWVVALVWACTKEEPARSFAP
jgi:hypothetical protein